MRAEGSRPPRGPDSQLKPCPLLEGFSPEMLCATYLWLQLVEDFFFLLAHISQYKNEYVPRGN